MSDVITKYAQLVDLMLEKTRESKIPWDYDSSRATVSVWNKRDVLVSLSRSDDDNHEDVFTVALFNRAGDYLEGFNDETLSGIELEFDEDNYFTRLRDLYNLAMRQATGADRALDDLIQSLRNDALDLPF